MNAPAQTPAPGSRLIRLRGDVFEFRLELPNQRKGRAFLRTNLGHAAVRRREVVDFAEKGRPPLSRDWHDLPMREESPGRFRIVLPLAEVGRFEAKAFFAPDEGNRNERVWPDGPNVQLGVEPAETGAGNALYVAFVRQFGRAKTADAVAPEDRPCIERLDDREYTVIPKSGTFRDLIRELDFIVGHLRCGILQLLPIHPVPTTYARMGRFGCPFAALDFFAVDPSLAEFDPKATPMQQFLELVDAVHARNAQLWLDMPANHTGWASVLQNRHPEWFERNPDGSFKSPGAWGITWADLVQLDHDAPGLREELADIFLFWCRNGVDGFRCDAGYMIPFAVWEYVIARVRDEYPDAEFLLEGLGGPKEVTERLLAKAGMNRAYSEIFQNLDRAQIDAYLPESLRVSETAGNLVHFAETHDNARLAAVSPIFARLRVAFCALTARNGAFGFANGVEWLATEKIDVHEARSLNRNAEPNLVEWIRRIHALMELHPAFHAGADVRLVTAGEGNAAAVFRTDAAGQAPLLVLANLDHENETSVDRNVDFSGDVVDLLSGASLRLEPGPLRLPPGEVLCLSPDPGWLDRIRDALAEPYRQTEAAERQRLRAKLTDLSLRFPAKTPSSE